MFCRQPALNAISVDPDQMQRSVASDLSVHCLSVSLLGEVRSTLVSGLK